VVNFNGADGLFRGAATGDALLIEGGALGLIAEGAEVAGGISFIEQHFS